MTVLDCYYYTQEALNKLATNSSQNVSKSSFVRTFNAVQLQWVEDRVKLNEVNNIRIDEIQQLLTQSELKVKKEPLYFYSALPANYYHARRVRAKVGQCSMGCYPAKEGDVNVLLNDEFWKPSKEWGETFYTLAGDQVRVYHDNQFTVSSIDFLYYRLPVNINMADGFDDVNGVPTVNVNPEFTGSSLIEILNLTVQHLAGNINDQLRYQVYSNKAQVHT